MNNYYKHNETTVYGKNNLSDTTLLKNLYLKGVTRIKLHRGGYYDLYYSTGGGYYTVKSPVQYDIHDDPIYMVTDIEV